MFNLYLDPFLFSCPDNKGDAGNFEDYIENIVFLRELEYACWVRIYIYEETNKVLLETSTYPTWKDLASLMQRFSIKHFQTKDIFNAVYSLLEKTPSVENRLKVKEILFENVKCSPTYHLKERHGFFTEHHNRLLIMMCIVCSFESEQESNQIFLTRYFN